MQDVINLDAVRELNVVQRKHIDRIIPPEYIGDLETELKGVRHVDDDTFTTIMRANGRRICRFVTPCVCVDTDELRCDVAKQARMAKWLQAAPGQLAVEVRESFETLGDLYVGPLQVYPRLEGYVLYVFMAVVVAYTTECQHEDDVVEGVYLGNSVPGSSLPYMNLEDLP